MSEMRGHFSVEADPSELLRLIPQIKKLADAEKNALGFLPEQAIRDAVIRKCLFAITVGDEGSNEVAGYLLHSGVFPHAKIQQIATSPNFRNQQVGSSLIRYLVSELERFGFISIKAEVASDLEGALKFYAKNGFESLRSREGGRSRNRRIIIHERQLETENLFTTVNSGSEPVIDLGIRRRSAGEFPYFAFDLNVYFDLAKNRENSERARRLFGAALAHQIRLAVANEFVIELQRTTKNTTTDAILQLALRLPRIPVVDQVELDELATRIHHMVFVESDVKSKDSVQAKSDARHLAHAALARASAFVTGDGDILAARNQLLSVVGIDVVTVSELIDLLPTDEFTRPSGRSTGKGFVIDTISGSEFRAYLRESRAHQSLEDEFALDENIAHDVQRQAIMENGVVVAIGALKSPVSIEPVSRLMIHVRPEQPDTDLFADCLLDRFLRVASDNRVSVIELVHIPGQSPVHNLAKSRSFVRNSSNKDYSKIMLGRPVYGSNWSRAINELRRKTGWELPAEAPSSVNDVLRVVTASNSTLEVSPIELEDLLSPCILIWEDRVGALVPIRRVYADELLGTGNQPSFDFITNHDAAFSSRRSFVNSPRTAAAMRPDAPILFYESQKSGGRGAVIAVARIVDTVVVQKRDIPNEHLRKLVVDDVDSFSASDDVLLTTFDNLFKVPQPVPLRALRQCGAVDGSNLVAPVSVSSNQITQILSLGWNDE